MSLNLKIFKCFRKWPSGASLCIAANFPGNSRGTERGLRNCSKCVCNRGGTILCFIFVGLGSKPLPHPSPNILRLSNEPAPNFTEAIASGFDCLVAPNVMNESRNKLPLSGILAQRFGYSVCLILIPEKPDNDDNDDFDINK
ncbi:uncharacterized protein LOC134220225 [Armigeres subalbatus]|uniref:uncharacterized protein LOC134220225 n=1 Tax=Armigeres subalbatus TaxID=124917 RepID=UPI002ED5760E